MTLENSNKFIKTLTKKTADGLLEWKTLRNYNEHIRDNIKLNYYIDTKTPDCRTIYLDESFCLSQNNGLIVIVNGEKNYRLGCELTEFSDFMIQTSPAAKLVPIVDIYGEYVETLVLAIKNHIYKDLDLENDLDKFMADFAQGC